MFSWFCLRKSMISYNLFLYTKNSEPWRILTWKRVFDICNEITIFSRISSLLLFWDELRGPQPIKQLLFSTWWANQWLTIIIFCIHSFLNHGEFWHYSPNLIYEEKLLIFNLIWSYLLFWDGLTGPNPSIFLA